MQILFKSFSFFHKKRRRRYCYQGKAKPRLKDYEGTLSDYTKNIEIDRRPENDCFGLGCAKCNLCEYEGGLLEFSKGIEQNPNIFVYHECNGMAKHHLKDDGGAMADHTKATHLDSNNKASAYTIGAISLAVKFISDIGEAF